MTATFLDVKRTVKHEKAIFIHRKDDFLDSAERIYFGNEFCEKSIPEIDTLKEWHVFSRNKGRKFTFVTPFVTNEGIERLLNLFIFLNRQKDNEVVFNDWGVFHLLHNRFSSIIPVMGRLLTKQRRDPRFLKVFMDRGSNPVIKKRNGKEEVLFLKKPPRELFEHYQASLINAPGFQKFLLSLGIRRIEIDHLLWKMNIDVCKELGVSVYFPYAYVTTSRKCSHLTMSYSACKKECKKYFLRLEGAPFIAPIYGIGNSVFYKCDSFEDDNFRRCSRLRIIYEPRFPF
jgi:hypothetical protein